MDNKQKAKIRKANARKAALIKDGRKFAYGRFVLVPAIAVEFGQEVNCCFCGRQNYPKHAWNKYHADGFMPDHSLYLVDRNELREPVPQNSAIMCGRCVKQHINDVLHTKDFALDVKGTCTNNVAEYYLFSTLNIQGEKGLRLWLESKHHYDSENFDILTGMDVALWLKRLWKTCALYCDGFLCLDKCYPIMCEVLNLPYNAEEHKLSYEAPPVVVAPTYGGPLNPTE